MGGKSGGGDDQTVRQEPWKGVQGPLKQLYGNVGALQPQAYYPGQTYAPASPLTMSGLYQNIGFGQGPGADYLSSAMQTGQSLMGAADVANNPYVRNQLLANADVIGQSFREDMLPAIQSGFLAAGQLGSGRQGVAEGIGMGRAADALARTNAQTMLGAYGQGLDAQARSLGLLPQTLGAGLFPGQQLTTAGEYLRQQGQMPIDEAMARYNFNQQAPFDLYGFQSGIYSGAQPYASSTQNVPGGSPIAGAVGGGMLGYGLSSIAPFTGIGALPLTVGGALLGGLFS